VARLIVTGAAVRRALRRFEFLLRVPRKLQHADVLGILGRISGLAQSGNNGEPASDSAFLIFTVVSIVQHHRQQMHALATFLHALSGLEPEVADLGLNVAGV
jgi:hypothetical protein